MEIAEELISTSCKLPVAPEARLFQTSFRDTRDEGRLPNPEWPLSYLCGSRNCKDTMSPPDEGRFLRSL